MKRRNHSVETKVRVVLEALKGQKTVSLYDREGRRLSTVRLARMPESSKATLKSQLTLEVQAALAQRPDLTVVKLADRAKDNWTYLSQALPLGPEMVDFYHAADHLQAAFDKAYGEHTPKAQAQFKKCRHLLLKEPHGVERVIRALTYLGDKYPRRTKLTKELAYFRHNRYRMRYAVAKAKRLPIGSGVVEAACKTLTVQRMKRSGMRWCHPGGQAILTLHTLVQSERFDRGWELLSETCKRIVSIPENVILFPN
jgi:hypothetical protein